MVRWVLVLLLLSKVQEGLALEDRGTVGDREANDVAEDPAMEERSLGRVRISPSYATVIHHVWDQNKQVQTNDFLTEETSGEAEKMKRSMVTIQPTLALSSVISIVLQNTTTTFSDSTTTQTSTLTSRRTPAVAPMYQSMIASKHSSTASTQRSTIVNTTLAFFFSTLQPITDDPNSSTSSTSSTQPNSNALTSTTTVTTSTPSSSSSTWPQCCSPGEVLYLPEPTTSPPVCEHLEGPAISLPANLPGTGRHLDGGMAGRCGPGEQLVTLRPSEFNLTVGLKGVRMNVLSKGLQLSMEVFCIELGIQVTCRNDGKTLNKISSKYF